MSRYPTIELSDGVHTDEPIGFMVFDIAGEACLYSSFRDAVDFANECGADQSKDWDIYPLYATHPVSTSDVRHDHHFPDPSKVKREAGK